MARSEATIKQQMVNWIAGVPLLAPLVVSPSQVQYCNNFLDIVARCVNFLEQLMDALKSELDSSIGKGAVSSEAWWQAKVLEFQYSATTPQVLTLIDYVPGYATIDTTLRVVTRCSVKTLGGGLVTIKYAVNEPPVAASSPVQTALQSYCTQLADAGIKVTPVSYNSDKFWLRATITYNGQYQSTIQTTVIAAINNYLSNITFDGNIKLLTLTDYVQAVPGVSDFVIQDCALRPDAVAFSGRSYLVQSYTTIYSTYQTFAGYVTEETTSGQDFASTLTFIAQ